MPAARQQQRVLARYHCLPQKQQTQKLAVGMYISFMQDCYRCQRWVLSEERDREAGRMYEFVDALLVSNRARIIQLAIQLHTETAVLKSRPTAARHKSDSLDCRHEFLAANPNGGEPAAVGPSSQWFSINRQVRPAKPCTAQSRCLRANSGSTDLAAFCRYRIMAKSKNHTAHNQTYKAHRNGIKKPKQHKYSSNKGVRILATWSCTLSDGTR